MSQIISSYINKSNLSSYYNKTKKSCPLPSTKVRLDHDEYKWFNVKKFAFVKAIIEEHGLRGNTDKVLIEIAKHSSHVGITSVSRETIAKKLKVSVRTVTNHLRKLVQFNIISREDGGWNKSCITTILLINRELSNISYDQRENISSYLTPTLLDRDLNRSGVIDEYFNSQTRKGNTKKQTNQTAKKDSEMSSNAQNIHTRNLSAQEFSEKADKMAFSALKAKGISDPRVEGHFRTAEESLRARDKFEALYAVELHKAKLILMAQENQLQEMHSSKNKPTRTWENEAYN